MHKSIPDFSPLLRHEDMLTPQGIEFFQQHIWDFFAQNERVFSWRQTHTPYHIVVSEVMLQQTQTDRVKTKFEQFIAVFPDFASLAAASVADVTREWQGLGYNRRGLYLRALAQRVVQEFDGMLPADEKILATMPGIGPATAASICAFAFNMPTVFIETNIRTVFITLFFRDYEAVTDKQIRPLVAQTVPHDTPRLWYYALMDYGVMLKKSIGNASQRSAHYKKQSKFIGSDRQIRGGIIRTLSQSGSCTVDQLCEQLGAERERLSGIVEKLCAEKFLQNNEGYIAFACDSTEAVSGYIKSEKSG